MSAEALKAAVILRPTPAAAISWNWTNHKALPISTHTHEYTHTHTVGKERYSRDLYHKTGFLLNKMTLGLSLGFQSHEPV